MKRIWRCVVFSDINLQKSISIFMIYFFFGIFCFGINIFNNQTNVWESVAYNWPWENIGVLKFKPTCLMNCPCDLLIVIAITTSNENYFLVNIKGICNCKVTLKMNVVSPTWLLINICASMTQLLKHVIISCQPLQNSHFETMFHNNIIGHLALRWSFTCDNCDNSK
jgi:hypothetical protein